ncbi:MAG: hypothetical protein AB7U97_21230 [Pirellulales bacterium]
MTAKSHPVAPQQNWAYVEDRLRAHDAKWLRALSVEERFVLYQDLFQVLRSARQHLPGDWKRLEQHQWEEKLVLRQRFLDAISKLDQWRSEQTAANHSG